MKQQKSHNLVSNIAYMSDLHLENKAMEQNPSPAEDGVSILVLAGDITTRARVDWIIEMSYIFNHVIFVPGNHEYYRGDLTETPRKMQEQFDEANAINIHMLMNRSIIINGTSFHGTTLWTDYDNQNPMSMFQAKTMMNDFRVIRANSYETRWSPELALREHIIAKQYLIDNVKPGDVVITHHAPSFRSIDVEFESSPINGAYCSNLDEMVMDLQPALWFHGHTHMPHDYMIDRTRVLCNPRGYIGFEPYRGFNLDAVVVIGNET